jgi:SnoaL-like protein
MLSEGISLQELGRLFIEGFNQRDAESLVRLAAEEIDFRPTSLVGKRTVYRGHDGIRQWVSELANSPVKHEIQIREVKTLDEANFVVLCEVLVEGVFLSPAAMVARVNSQGQIVEAHSYLSDELLLARLGLVPEPATGGAPDTALT